MGIAGLWPLLEPTCQPVALEALEGKILAVDVSIWIYQAQLGYPGEVRCPHLALLVSRLCKLIYYKIKPVFVFDGMAVPSFKNKVLDERRLRKHADEVGLSRSKKRHLLDLATGSQTQAEIEAVKKKLAAENTKRQLLENNLFDILPTKPLETVELSDEDDDAMIVEKRQFYPDTLPSNAVGFLVEERERIRADRLRPSQIPTDSKTFSDFQLKRLLFRSGLNKRIQQLCQNPEVLPNEIPQLTVDSTSCSQTPRFSLSDDGSQKSTSDDSDSGEVYSKTTMIENHAKRNMVHRTAGTVILRSDDWSSDSGTDDFIDVPSIDLPLEHDILASETKQESEKEEVNFPSISQVELKCEADYSSDETSEHWDPALDEDLKWSNKEDVRTDTSAGRDSDSYKDLQDFLSACGFPWIEAPGEAEAQCVQLEKLGLVQGVISDDSDVWAFGASCVYRHLFSKNRNVQHYESRVIQQSLGLSQSEIVGLAVISGGDYSSSLTGIGVVNALELLSEFAAAKSSTQSESQECETIKTLKNIEEWMMTFESNVESPEPSPIRRKLRSAILKNNDMDKIKSIVNDEVVAAYFHPNVDNSTEKFRWRSVDINCVRHLLYNRLGWDDEKFEKQTLIALQRWNDFISGKTSYQRHITSYMCKLQQSPDEQKTKLTKRVETALVKLSKRTGSSSNISAVSTEPVKRTLPKKKQHPRKRGRQLRNLNVSQNLQLSEESDFDSD
ncbi:hypothetical protein KIN20_018348 [Parelaphostrongylus tenuis]|uniref:Uncharacterized protein n=1 Tax=Parelaphostrongylus tenuis TaxID=148309 RepID=A0AAD5MJ81_PARTN|nr:hypothetical protein KIN20_018348 [Parelaphostrongylus tenuis]